MSGLLLDVNRVFTIAHKQARVWVADIADPYIPDPRLCKNALENPAKKILFHVCLFPMEQDLVGFPLAGGQGLLLPQNYKAFQASPKLIGYINPVLQPVLMYPPI